MADDAKETGATVIRLSAYRPATLCRDLPEPHRTAFKELCRWLRRNSRLFDDMTVGEALDELRTTAAARIGAVETRMLCDPRVVIAQAPERP